MVYHKSLEYLIVFCVFAEKGRTKHGPRYPVGISCATKPCESGVLTQEILWWLSSGRLARVSGTKHLLAWGRLLSCWLRGWMWPQITPASVSCQEIWFQIYCSQEIWVNLKAHKDVQHVDRWSVTYFYPRQGKAIFWSILGCRRKSWLFIATKPDSLWNLNHFFPAVHQPCKCHCQTEMPQWCRWTNKTKWRGRNIHVAGWCGRSWHVGSVWYKVRFDQSLQTESV